jgi:hypothetical protein
MAATGGAAGVHLVHQKRDSIVARRWHLEGTWMSKKIAADHIKLKRAAVRNRERVLEAAKAVFSAGGAEASLEAVARAAGVGIRRCR